MRSASASASEVCIVNGWTMAKNILLPISLLIILSTSQVDCMDYMNNTIDFAKIVDDFSFHQPIKGQRSERNGRRLISFDTRNDNIEVFKSSAIVLQYPICYIHSEKA